jgi:2-C-methyl-D-erythritol 4-phosphate cytidylyltransferase
MRTKAFGVEPPGDLLESQEVARTSVDVLVSEITGQVIDVRRPVGTVGS